MAAPIHNDWHTMSATRRQTPSRVQTTSQTVVHSSPHYTTTRRHSLYGTEDRIILDPGSAIWKVGFSGEGKPRAVLYPDPHDPKPLWSLNRAPDLVDREEEDRLLHARLQTALANVFHKSVSFLSSGTLTNVSDKLAVD